MWRLSVMVLMLLAFEPHFTLAQAGFHSGALSAKLQQRMLSITPSSIIIPNFPQALAIPPPPIPMPQPITPTPVPAPPVPPLPDTSVFESPELSAQARLESDHIAKATNLLAVEDLETFAPTTQTGQEKLATVIDFLQKNPLTQSFAQKLASNPNVVLNVLEDLKGSFLLRQGYKYLGGQEEVDSHTALMQASKVNIHSSFPALTKAAGTFLFANIMLVFLMLSELEEFLHWTEYRPGVTLTEEELHLLGRDQPDVEEEESLDGVDEASVNTDHEEGGGVVNTVLDKVEALSSKVEGPMKNILEIIAERSHGFVMLGGEKSAKVAFVWLVLIISWSAMFSIMQSIAFSADSASAIVKGAGTSAADSFHPPPPPAL